MVYMREMVRTRGMFQGEVEKYYLNYPWKHFKKYPEFCIEKLGLSEAVLENLNNNPDERSREEIRDWMKSYLTYDKISYVGW